MRVDGLKPKTTYYYSVGSMGGNGRVDPVNSAVYHFTTP
ncbi:MAG: fibronectin type III domain-containing protein [Silvibacterium sp.]